MQKKPQNLLRLITHVIGEVLIVFGSIFITLNITGNVTSPYSLPTGLFAILVGAFCQWNSV